MTKQEVDKLTASHKKFFLTGQTLNPHFRVTKLKELKKAIKENMNEINNALFLDLGKSADEGYMSEIGMVLEELTCVIKNTVRWSKPKIVATPLAQFASKSYKMPMPHGTALIISPWNYPFMLTLSPLVDCLSAGNTAIIKPSSTTINTSQIIKKIIEQVFDSNYVKVVLGSHETTTFLLEQNIDHIFFTGSPKIGKEVQKHASHNLTPVTLELGGKSPCVVDSTANISLAAKRIVFGKFLNCGQTCVAPDYIYCHQDVKEQLLEEIKTQIVMQYGPDPLKTKYMGRIVSERHFSRLEKFAQSKKLTFGGRVNKDSLQIEPTLLDNITFKDSIMQEEIFGPILPIVTFSSEQEALEKLKTLDSPLAFYIFSQNNSNINMFTSSLRFGGGCVNDCVIHLASTKLGFGGVGSSGMGTYHGKNGFDTFSHYKSIVDKKTWIDLPFRYAPYTKLKSKLIKMFLK